MVSLEGDGAVPDHIRVPFAALNPWTVRFTQPAYESAQALVDQADKAALEALRVQLAGFPPPKHQFQMRLDVSRGGLEVWAVAGPHLRLHVTAIYRLLREECAITHVSISKSSAFKQKGGLHGNRAQTKALQPGIGATHTKGRSQR